MTSEESYGILSEYDNKQTYKGYFYLDGIGTTELEYVIIDGLAIFQDDIILGSAHEVERSQMDSKNGTVEAALVVLGKRWSNYNNIPYQVGNGETIVNLNIINEAIQDINNNTNVRFVEKNPGHIDYILIKEDIEGTGSSECGFSGGEQIVHLNKQGKFKKGNVIHELCHALGFYHEHSRQDRDGYIDIKFENIIEDKKHNFTRLTSSDEIDVDNYDYHSIMHYGQYAFSKNRDMDRTIITKDPTYQAIIGQRDGLSQTDISGLNALTLKQLSLV